METPDQLFRRVANAIARAEKSNRRGWAEKFYKLISSLRFLPNSPTLMNAGRDEGQLAACFVLPIEDSLESIFETLKDAAKIHQSGGGTGFSFSSLRPRGSRVRSSSGVASGPVSFIRIFDVATEAIKQGGTRRGANMAVLRVDHPDIIEFIDSKRDQRSTVNFNISVGITDRFMDAVRADALFPLFDPQTGREQRKVRARAVFDRICLAAWECGDPGLVFLDRINLFNPTPAVGRMESTNPCGEQPLLQYESCNLGSINLGLYCRGGDVDWMRLCEDVHLATRILDDVVSINHYPIAECERITQRNRKIGLGVMGFADLLLELGLPYDSVEARALGEKLMSVIDREGRRASADLAREKGAFLNYSKSMWRHLGFPKLRNATVTTVAPTGTISIIAGASSGIEPIFAGIFYRNVLSGDRLREVHPAVARILQERKIGLDEVSEEDLGRLLGPAWSPARSVSVSGHVLMQAVFQRFSDSAVSKTINLPEEATVLDVASAYLLAYENGCKGITVYRDRSKPTQVLESASSTDLAVPDCPTC